MLIYKYKVQISFALAFVILVVVLVPVPIYAESENPYTGIPTVTLRLSDIDSSGNLIYVGIDFGVFADNAGNGTYSCVRAKRFFANSTNISVDLGTEYEKGVKHKCAYRILYITAGQRQDDIIIANWDNGKEGWIPLDESLFVPSYFVGGVANAVTHTAIWTANREVFNEKSAFGIRTSGTWWSGEKFILYFTLNDDVAKVKVTIDGYPEYSATFTTASAIREISSGKYHYDYDGEIFDSSMINRWGNYVPQKLTFIFSILDNEGNILEEQTSDVFVDNAHSYFRVRKVKL